PSAGPELTTLAGRIEIGPAGHEHRFRPVLRHRPRRVGDGTRREIGERRQPHHLKYPEAGTERGWPETDTGWVRCVIAKRPPEFAVSSCKRSQRDHVGGLAEGGLHGERLLEREERQLVGTDARRLALTAELERAEDLLGSDRNLVDSHADRVVHRVRDGRDHRQERPLPSFLGPEWSLGIV